MLADGIITSLAQSSHSHQHSTHCLIDDHLYNEQDTAFDVHNGSSRPLVDSLLLTTSSQTCAKSGAIILCGHVEKEGTFMEELICMVKASVHQVISATDSICIGFTWTALSPLDSSPSMLSQGPIRDIEDASRLLSDGREARKKVARRRGQLHTLISLTLSSSDGTRALSRLDFIQLSSLIKPSSSRNLSLSLNTLTAVIAALKLNKSQLAPPYRDSSLTLWLKDSLKDARYLLFLGYLSPLPGDSGDSMSTLSFVSRQRTKQGGGIKVSAIFEATENPPHSTLPLSAEASHPSPLIDLSRNDPDDLKCDMSCQTISEETSPLQYSPSKSSPYDVILFLRGELEATRQKIQLVDAEVKLRDEEVRERERERSYSRFVSSRPF